MKAVVTGGAGFIGSHIAEALLSEGVDVIVIDDLSAGKIENIPSEARFLKADISDIGSGPYYGNILNRADVVFHNAASKKRICLKNPVRDMEVNGIGTLKLLEACRKAGVPNFIHASTGSVYGEVNGPIMERTPTNPVSYYGVSKLAGERYAIMYSRYLNVIALRYFHVYGDRQEDDPDVGGVIAIFKRQIREGGPITIHGLGDQKRVFTHVNDVVDANLKAWASAKLLNGNVYNCGSNRQISIMQMAGSLIRRSGKPIPIEYGPPLEGDIYNFQVDNSRIFNDLRVSFRPYVL